jgi:hypothetical protein
MIGNRKSRSADIRSRVVPFFPRFWEGWSGWIVLDSAGIVEVEADEGMEEVCVMPIGKVFCESFEGNEESEDFENKP